MSRFLIAHDMDADDGRKWFVIDKAKADGVGATWAEINEIRNTLQKECGKDFPE